MDSRARSRRDSAAHQMECAQNVVRILFKKTGLSTIVRKAPTVVVCAGNWISLTVHQVVSSEVIFGLTTPRGKLAFVPDLFNRRRKARSKTSPSLHLTNLDSGENLRGHVDAHYWIKNPFVHAYEFLKRKTTPPSDLLKRFQTRSAALERAVRSRKYWRSQILLCKSRNLNRKPRLSFRIERSNDSASDQK